MNHSGNNHYITMFFIMILSGLLTTMNVWVDKLDDIRYSLNDVYMILLMSGWMFLFMGLINQEFNIIWIGLLLVIINIWCIRTQFLITETQYKLGMIPHHSMAVHMSKKLLEKDLSTVKDLSINYKTKSFVKNIIKTQEKEIDMLKQ